MFGDRLKLARKKAGYSLRRLSDALQNEVSAQAIGKYERGEMMPSSDVLTSLAKVLGVSLEYFLSDQVQELKGVEFRKNSGTSARDRTRVEAQVIERVERYLSIEEILDLESADWHEPFRPRNLKSLDQAEKLADDLRGKWGLGTDPIPNMTELLEEKGIKVIVIDLPDGVFGLTCFVDRGPRKKSVPVIVVNSSVSLERRRFTLAHELGHRFVSSSSSIHHEKVANRFAGAFLVPRTHLKQEIGAHRRAVSYPEIAHLKRIYRIGAAAMLMRLKDVGILSESAVAYAFQTFASPWRKTEPDPLEDRKNQGKHEQPKRFKRLCYWALSEQLISPGKATELLQMPLCQIEEEYKGPVSANAHNC